jgi:NAD(P)H-flavin reductase
MSADPRLPVAYRVAGKHRELDDTWTLELEPAGDADRLGKFEPGQFAMLYAFGAGEVPISVSATTDGTLVHTVRAVGAVSAAVCRCEPGDQLGARGPYGNRWPLGEAEGGDVVVVAGGIGLAPLRPAIEHLVARRDRYGSVAVLYGARSPAEILYPADIERWRSAGVQVEVTVDGAPPGWDGRVGLVTTLIPAGRFDADQATAMVCGPEVMMRFVASALREHGVDARRIHVSLERNMKCAVGFCGRCQLGQRFICKDGAVFAFDRVESLLAVREL